MTLPSSGASSSSYLGIVESSGRDNCGSTLAESSGMISVTVAKNWPVKSFDSKDPWLYSKEKTTQKFADCSEMSAQ